MKPRSRISTIVAAIICMQLLAIVSVASRHHAGSRRSYSLTAAVITIPAPVPVPTPRIVALRLTIPEQAPSPVGDVPWTGPAGCLVLLSLGLGLGVRRRLARRPPRRRTRDAGLRKVRPARRISRRAMMLVALALTVGTLPPMRTAASQSPSAYLGNAIDWLQAHYVQSDYVDWPTLRRQALAIARGARTTADSYPAIFFVVRQLGDPGTFFLKPALASRTYDSGFDATYPGGDVYKLTPGGAAERAGLRLGDQIISMNGHPITGDQFATTIDPPVVAQVRLVVRRAGLARPLIITITADPFRDQAGNSSTGSLLGLGSRTAGYIDLQWAPGGPAPAGQERWTDQTQGVIRSLDHAGACGWMVDLRDTSSGDLWSYLAALGPLLNPGVKGGFANPDGTHDSWSYRAGKVYWDGMERLGADVLSGPPYSLRRSHPPIAVLTDSTTLSAGELIAIMFAEHSPSSRFGEPTAGSPNEVMGTTLSDGAILAASIASGVDNQGMVYGNQPLAPDQFVSIDWGNRGGSLRDPVVRAAANWLATQSACRR